MLEKFLFYFKKSSQKILGSSNEPNLKSFHVEYVILIFYIFYLYISFSLFAMQRERNVPKERENTQSFYAFTFVQAFLVFGFAESITLAIVIS